MTFTSIYCIESIHFGSLYQHLQFCQIFPEKDYLSRESLFEAETFLPVVKDAREIFDKTYNPVNLFILDHEIIIC